MALYFRHCAGLALPPSPPMPPLPPPPMPPLPPAPPLGTTLASSYFMLLEPNAGPGWCLAACSSPSCTSDVWATPDMRAVYGWDQCGAPSLSTAWQAVERPAGSGWYQVRPARRQVADCARPAALRWVAAVDRTHRVC